VTARANARVLYVDYRTGRVLGSDDFHDPIWWPGMPSFGCGWFL
jgi:hypothetical protein